MVLLTIETLHTTVIRQTHGAIVAVVVVTGVVLLVCTIVVFNMARELTIKQDKYTFESLEDVCEFMLLLQWQDGSRKDSPHHDSFQWQ